MLMNTKYGQVSSRKPAAWAGCEVLACPDILSAYFKNVIIDKVKVRVENHVTFQLIPVMKNEKIGRLKER